VVPGDIVVIKPGTVYCDLVIVQAHQVVVDESALTGEATPVTKTQLDPSMKSVTYKAESPQIEHPIGWYGRD
jgi:P-type E1-E2 ATPase